MIVYQLETPIGITAPVIEYGLLSSIVAYWNAKGFNVIVLNQCD